MNSNVVQESQNDDHEHLKLAVDYAWGWFSMHSSQRMQLINFFIIALTLMMGAYATSVNAGAFGVSAAIALGGAVLAFVFRRLDVRTRELVKVSEPALEEIERRLAERAELSELNFVRIVERPKARWGTYRILLMVATWVAFILFSLGFGFAIVLLIGWAELPSR